MDARFVTRVPAPPDRVFPVVADLATYPRWMAIVSGADASDSDDPPAWDVQLGAGVGPVKLTKRVRMVRVHEESPRSVRFERAELDGEDHPAWILSAAVEPVEPHGSASEVSIHLHYSGAPSIPPIEALLSAEARRAGPRLGQVVAERAD